MRSCCKRLRLCVVYLHTAAPSSSITAAPADGFAHRLTLLQLASRRVASYACLVANLILPGGERLDIPRRLWFPSVMTLLSLFAGGLYLGKLISGPQPAGAAYWTTETIHGKVVKVAGKPVRVLVPARTIYSQGKIVTVIAPHTVDLTQTRRATTIISTVRGTRTLTQTTTVPTTITTVTTVPTTVTQTGTVTETITETVTDTGTTTVSTSGPTT